MGGGERGEREEVQRREGGRHGRCGGGVPALRATTPLAPSPPASPRRGQGGGRARRAHMSVSAVRRPSCVGTLPLRLLSSSSLRARGAPAWGGERWKREGVQRCERGRHGRCGRGVPAPRATTHLAPSPSATPRRGQGGGRARRAHMRVSAVRRPSCVGRLPLRLLPLRSLRARGAPAGGRERGEREGRRGAGRGGMAGAGAACQPHVPLPPRPPASPRRGQGGGRARRAHMTSSAVRRPSCVGTVPLRLLP